MIASAIALLIISTERIASSLPAIGTVSTSGSALVSAMAITGMPSLFASEMAIFSRLLSITKSAPGSRAMSLTPDRYLSRRSRSRSSIRRSFFV